MKSFDRLPQAWQACVSHWLAGILAKSGSQASQLAYASAIYRFFQHCEWKDPALVTRADVVSFLELPSRSRRNTGLPASASTRNLRLTIIQGCYTYASAYAVPGPDGTLAPLYQRALPTTGLHMSKPASQPRSMSESELSRLFAALPDTAHGRKLRTIFYLYVVLGRRKSELLKMRFGDLQPAVIAGKPSFTYKYVGKGDSRRTRQKELPQAAYEAIIDLLRDEGRLNTIQADDYLFVDPKGHGRQADTKGQHLGVHYVAQQFHVYALAAGLPVDRLSLHSLRWTHARYRYEQSNDILEVKTALDHESIGTTMHYLMRETSPADPGAANLAAKFASFNKANH